MTIFLRQADVADDDVRPRLFECREGFRGRSSRRYRGAAFFQEHFDCIARLWFVFDEQDFGSGGETSFECLGAFFYPLRLVNLSGP